MKVRRKRIRIHPDSAAADSRSVPVGSMSNESGTQELYAPLFVAPDADILVADMDSMTLRIFKGLLEPTRVLVSTASDGEECLERIQDTRFHVAFLDQRILETEDAELL